MYISMFYLKLEYYFFSYSYDMIFKDIVSYIYYPKYTNKTQRLEMFREGKFYGSFPKYKFFYGDI